jgi:hypothetical protein
MGSYGWVVGLSVLLQVPAPQPGNDAARELETARRSILAREKTDLEGLVERLSREGNADAARIIRGRIPRQARADGPTRLMPLPEVVAPAARDRESLPLELSEIQHRAASGLFDVALRAGKGQTAQYALASFCLREVIERQPDHPEARRLLGYVPHEGGWATPFAVRQLNQGNVDHPIFGWVPEDWVPHLDGGELPAPVKGGQNKPRWLPTAEADRLREDWKSGWRFATEHFEIHTNVPLAEAISFGRRVEAFHDLFTTLLADILGEKLPLVRRFKDTKLEGEGSSNPKLHLIFYFASKQEFVDYLSPQFGADIAENLGFYLPPKTGRGRVPAYFFRDPRGLIPVTETLYHEVSHQLLFEIAGPNAYTKNVGNAWVFEGMGVYFETVNPQPDGSLEVGGLVGRRMEEAVKSLVDHGQAIPLARFVALDERVFRGKPQVYLNYQQAMALTVFLMQWHDGLYRDGFLDYLRDAYRGVLRPGRSLQDRLGERYPTLDDQFLKFMKSGAGSLHAAQADRARSEQREAIGTFPPPEQ